MNDNQMIEAGARAIARSQGHDPDDLAPRAMMCTADNQQVQWWHVFEEEAEACLADAAARIEALEAALANERERCIAVCESWIGTFQKFELKHTGAREYAVDAIGDIIEVIREGVDPRAALDKDAGQ
jgi:hypothetical protein